MYSKDDLLCFNILEAANSIIEFTKEFNNVDAGKIINFTMMQQ
jgi:hypothetical protein